MISEAKGADFIEKMPSPEARISGDLAIVSGRYTFLSATNFRIAGRILLIWFAPKRDGELPMELRRSNFNAREI